MSQGVILGLAVVAGLACPLHMRWSHRRGRQAACCPPIRKADGDIESLRARQRRLSALIAEHQGAVADAVAEAHETAPS
jgi:hypothetical protein